MQHIQTLEKTKQILRKSLGKALDRVIIFGSVARGSATVASDIDMMVILDDEVERVDRTTDSRIRAIIYPIELEDDVVFDLKVMKRSELQGIHGHTPFVENVMREGIVI
jgi:predicted nucleotidyltransferase